MNVLNKNLLSEYLAKGNELCAVGEYQKAIDALDDVLKIDPKNVSALTSKRSVLEKIGKYQEAVEMHDEIDGALYNEVKEAQKSGNFLEAFTLASIKRWDHFCNTGLLLYRLGEYDAA